MIRDSRVSSGTPRSRGVRSGDEREEHVFGARRLRREQLQQSIGFRTLFRSREIRLSNHLVGTSFSDLTDAFEDTGCHAGVTAFPGSEGSGLRDNRFGESPIPKPIFAGMHDVHERTRLKTVSRSMIILQLS